MRTRCLLLMLQGVHISVGEKRLHAAFSFDVTYRVREGVAGENSTLLW